MLSFFRSGAAMGQMLVPHLSFSSRECHPLNAFRPCCTVSRHQVGGRLVDGACGFYKPCWCLCVCLYLYVCACERERERESECVRVYWWVEDGGRLCSSGDREPLRVCLTWKLCFGVVSKSTFLGLVTPQIWLSCVCLMLFVGWCLLWAKVGAVHAFAPLIDE